MSSVEDAEIVEAIVRRDPEALADLYSRYSNMFAALSYRVLGDPSDAEEVLQETFFQVWNQAERYDRSRSSVSTWLVLITRSRAIDRLRSRQVFKRTAIAAQLEKGNSRVGRRNAGEPLEHNGGGIFVEGVHNVSLDVIPAVHLERFVELGLDLGVSGRSDQVGQGLAKFPQGLQDLFPHF